MYCRGKGMAGLVSELASKAHAQQWEDLLEWDGETGNLARESIAMTSKAHVPQERAKAVPWANRARLCASAFAEAPAKPNC